MIVDPASFTPQYAKWRHGGWYVVNVRYPSGAEGCVSNNYDDRKWRIVCDDVPFEDRPTFKTRDEAARAELLGANEAWAKEARSRLNGALGGIGANADGHANTGLTCFI